MPTLIEWCRNPDGSPGETVNFAEGCSGSGCEVDRRGMCYARNLVKQFPTRFKCEKCRAFTPHFHIERLEETLRQGKPRGYFNSMGDPFDPAFKEPILIRDWLNLMACAKWHRYYVCTKQAQRLPKFRYPKNVWLMVTVNGLNDLWRIERLLETDAAIKGVSFEPLYTPVSWRIGSLKGIDWVIIGGETSRGKTTFTPDIEEVNRLTFKAQAVNAAVFQKDNLGLGKATIQEMPKVNNGRSV